MTRHGLLFFALVIVVLPGCDSSPPPKVALNSKAVVAAELPQQTEFLYCHWNVENFFDDKNDGRTGPGDKEYDPFVHN